MHEGAPLSDGAVPARRHDKAGAEPLTGTPAELAALIRDGVSKYAKIIKTAGIKPE